MTNKRNEEISLLDLFIRLARHKKIILFSSVATGIIFIVYNLFIVGIKKESRLTFLMDVPPQVETEYGTYKFLSQNVEDYLIVLKNKNVVAQTIEDLNLDIQEMELLNAVEFEKIEDKKVIDNPQKSIRLILNAKNLVVNDSILTTYYKNYINYLNYLTSKKVIDVLSNEIKTNIDRTALDLSAAQQLQINLDSLKWLSSGMSTNTKESIYWMSNDKSKSGTDFSKKTMVVDPVSKSNVMLDFVFLEEAVIKNELNIQELKVKIQLNQMKYDGLQNLKANLTPENSFKIFNAYVQLIGPETLYVGSYWKDGIKYGFLGIFVGLVIVLLVLTSKVLMQQSK
jgi:hypothetical protein